MKPIAWKPGEGPAPEPPVFAEISVGELAAAYRRVLERARASTIVAVCARCQEVIYAGEPIVHAPLGPECRRHGGNHQPKPGGKDDEQHGSD